MDFTAPYLQMHGTIFVRKGETSIRSEADLKDKEVLVMRDDASHEYAVSSNITAKLILTTSFEEAMKLLSSGEHDAILCQYLMGLQLIKRLSIKNIVSVSTTEDEKSLKPRTTRVSNFNQKFSFAVPEGRKKLLAQLNEGLAIVVANGTYDELYQKWFGPILPQPIVPLIAVIKSVLIILIPILFVLAVVGIWYLRREVDQKTRSLRMEIVEHKRAKDTIKMSENRYRSLYNDTPAMLQSIDSSGKLISISDFWCHALGYSRHEVAGRHVTEFLTEESKRYATETTLPEFFNKGYANNIEYQFVKKNGEIVDILLSSILEKDGDGNAIRSLAVLHDITERKQAEEQIKSNLKEKETLLQEIHHRVKNNMQLISSLLKLQANSIKDERVTTALTDSWNRIQAMSAVHEILYQSETLSSIDMDAYLSKLGRMVFQNYTISSYINLKIEVENVLIGVKRASPVGLIVNELISNSLKYAFPDKSKGEIKIRLQRIEQEQIELIYMDDGIGIPKDFDWYNAKSMGLNLVKILCEDQLKGSIKLNRDQGTCFVLKFKQKDITFGAVS